MANIPARCNVCGHTFYSGFSLGGRNSVVSDCITRCPKCRNAVSVNAATDSQGNIHIFANTAFCILSNQAIQVHDLRKFREIIKLNKPSKNEEEKTDFIETIKKELPELDEITNLLIPTNAGEFYGFLSFLLALITFLILMRGSNKEPNQTIINNFYNTNDPESEAYKAAYEQSGIKRKAPCPCGSGKKFKNCHGM